MVMWLVQGEEREMKKRDKIKIKMKGYKLLKSFPYFLDKSQLGEDKKDDVNDVM